LHTLTAGLIDTLLQRGVNEMAVNTTVFNHRNLLKI
jgi:hypothetical protein